jgi:glycosyltransferase involved in cell wall biosynthesis
MASVDIAIPNYNYGRYLRECVGSVLSQEVERLRVLVIDNASTDDSAEIARGLARSDPRVEIRIHEKNLGPHASYNEGIDWAASDYFLILCSDDALTPGSLRRAIAVMEAEPGIAFVHGKDIQVGERHSNMSVADVPRPDWCKISGRSFIEGFCRQGVLKIAAPTVVVRTAVQKKAGHYRPELPHTDDYDLWLRLALFGDVAELQTIQALLRVHGMNRASEFAARQVQQIEHTAMAADWFFTHEGAEIADASRLHRRARRGLAARAYWAGVSTLLRGEAGSMQLMKYAIRHHPAAALVPPVDYLFSRPDAVERIQSIVRGLALAVRA